MFRHVFAWSNENLSQLTWWLCKLYITRLPPRSILTKSLFSNCSQAKGGCGSHISFQLCSWFIYIWLISFGIDPMCWNWVKHIFRRISHFKMSWHIKATVSTTAFLFYCIPIIVHLAIHIRHEFHDVLNSFARVVCCKIPEQDLTVFL